MKKQVTLDGIDEEFGDLFKRYEGRCHAPRSQASSTIGIMSTLPPGLVAVSDCHNNRRPHGSVQAPSLPYEVKSLMTAAFVLPPLSQGRCRGHIGRHSGASRVVLGSMGIVCGGPETEP